VEVADRDSLLRSDMSFGFELYTGGGGHARPG
jgi:hypothetical protein